MTTLNAIAIIERAGGNVRPGPHMGTLGIRFDYAIDAPDGESIWCDAPELVRIAEQLVNDGRILGYRDTEATP